jgi:hypothetical protein
LKTRCFGIAEGAAHLLNGTRRTFFVFTVKEKTRFIAKRAAQQQQQQQQTTQ